MGHKYPDVMAARRAARRYVTRLWAKDWDSEADAVYDDFHEDDEPIEKIREAFDRGEKGITRRPHEDARRSG